MASRVFKGRKMKISIIVPVYNSQQYLAECLNSLLNQQLDDYEIICVNDGSTDNSSLILQKYAEVYPLIRIVDQENMGLPAARNAGLVAAKGEYVLHVDSDDRIEVDSLKALYDCAIKENADIVVFGGHSFPYSVDWINSVLKVKDRIVFDQVEQALFYEVGSRPFTWNKLYKKSIIEKYQLFYPESVELGEDQIYQFYVFPHAQRIAYLGRDFYWYRQTRNSMLTKYTSNSDARLIGLVFNYWLKLGILNKHAKDILVWALSYVEIDTIGESDIVTVKKSCERLSALFKMIDFSGVELNRENQEKMFLVDRLASFTPGREVLSLLILEKQSLPKILKLVYLTKLYIPLIFPRDSFSFKVLKKTYQGLKRIVSVIK